MSDQSGCFSSAWEDGTSRPAHARQNRAGHQRGLATGAPRTTTCFVYDDQHPGTEHKFLTDKERDFATRLKSQGKRATVTEWLDTMEMTTIQSLSDPAVNRGGAKPVGPQDAPLVARAIRLEYEDAGQRGLFCSGADLEAGQPGRRPDRLR